MRYDWRRTIPYDEFSRPFYEEIDRRFFLKVGEYMPWKSVPFDNLIDFGQLASKSVLEIGVGMLWFVNEHAPDSSTFSSSREAIHRSNRWDGRIALGKTPVLPHVRILPKEYRCLISRSCFRCLERLRFDKVGADANGAVVQEGVRGNGGAPAAGVGRQDNRRWAAGQLPQGVLGGLDLAQ